MRRKLMLEQVSGEMRKKLPENRLENLYQKECLASCAKNCVLGHDFRP